MYDATRQQDHVSCLLNYWWLIQLIWLIAMIGGIWWLYLITPSESVHYYYAGPFRPVLSYVLLIITIGGLPSGIYLYLRRFRFHKFGRLVAGYAIVLVAAIILTGPIIGRIFSYRITIYDHVKLNGEVYVLSEKLYLSSHRDGDDFDNPTRPISYHLLRCKEIFQHCKEVHVESGKVGIPKLESDGDTLSIVIAGETVFTLHPD